MFLFLSSLFVCFQLPGPLLILTSKTSCVVPARRQAARHHSHAIANVSWRMLLLPKPLVSLSNELFFGVSPPRQGYGTGSLASSPLERGLFAVSQVIW